MARKSKHYVEGASASLKKSIQELEDYLSGIGLTPSTGKLRKQLHKRISVLAEKSFERGFRRGCIEYQKLLPKKVSYTADRTFFGGRRAVDVSWKPKTEA